MSITEEILIHYNTKLVYLLMEVLFLNEYKY